LSTVAETPRQIFRESREMEVMIPYAPTYSLPVQVTWDKANVSLNVQSATTIQQLKQQLQDVFGVTPKYQQLYFSDDGADLPSGPISCSTLVRLEKRGVRLIVDDLRGGGNCCCDTCEKCCGKRVRECCSCCEGICDAALDF